MFLPAVLLRPLSEPRWERSARPAVQLGIVAVGAVGYAAGLLLCEWEPVESGFRDRLDFESKLRGFSADTAARERAVARLAATRLARNTASANC